MWRLFGKLFTGRNDNYFTYPLDTRDAVTGQPLKTQVPSDRLYKIGPFFCDTSPDSHKGQFANAIDFIVADGVNVYSARSGVVVDIVEHNDKYGPGSEFAGYLNYVTLDHGDCYSQYAHLRKNSVSQFGLRVGKEVMRGQIIGIVGKTGWVDFGDSGDHLHFMVFTGSNNSVVSQPVTFK